jgi:hypothetical protein
MKAPHTILGALLTFLLCSHAQAAPERTCRIVYVERPENAPVFLHLFDGRNSQNVELPSMNLSPTYKVAPGAIQLKLLAAEVEDPKEVPADAPSVEIPADFTNFLLLVLSDPDNKIAPVKLEAVNLDGENFKPGQTLWVNRTDMTIGGKLGEQILSLEPVSSKIVDAPVSDKGVPANGYYNASFTYQAGEKGAFEPITEQQWWHDARSRHLGFIVDSAGKLPKIFFYRDFRAAQD